MIDQAHRRQLHVGGTLDYREHIYIERSEDDELFKLLEGGEYSNILTSRQMGKSSLMMRTAARLIERGVHVATPDVSELGAPANTGSLVSRTPRRNCEGFGLCNRRGCLVEDVLGEYPQSTFIAVFAGIGDR